MTADRLQNLNPTIFGYGNFKGFDPRNIPKTVDMSAYTPKPNNLPTTNVPGYDMSNQMYNIPGRVQR